MKKKIKVLLISSIILITTFPGCTNFFQQEPEEQEPQTYSVTYNGNNFDSGEVPDDNTAYEQGDRVNVAEKGNMGQTGCIFIGWNTKLDGSGIHRAPGSTFTIEDNVILYAQWERPTEGHITLDLFEAHAIISKTVYLFIYDTNSTNETTGAPDGTVLGKISFMIDQNASGAGLAKTPENNTTGIFPNGTYYVQGIVDTNNNFTESGQMDPGDLYSELLAIEVYGNTTITLLNTFFPHTVYPVGEIDLNDGSCSISGQITDADNKGFPGVLLNVSFNNPIDENQTDILFLTDTDGNFTISGLPSGSAKWGISEQGRGVYSLNVQVFQNTIKGIEYERFNFWPLVRSYTDEDLTNGNLNNYNLTDIIVQRKPVELETYITGTLKDSGGSPMRSNVVQVIEFGRNNWIRGVIWDFAGNLQPVTDENNFEYNESTGVYKIKNCLVSRQFSWSLSATGYDSINTTVTVQKGVNNKNFIFTEVTK